ncbi:hypothetical protein SAY87_001778 [Trapa incisa]|uniref:Uncharacterized protein n=1 Tax=Trapa incisa TaxID=236973 RepID=A0AAN7JVL8_9MYRT|nr:hypothetical protein SAY87_001778 [Trapa incisa]
MADVQQIDPRHRYGHNLQFYYAQWLHCQSREPFFYWLDVGEGKEVNLLEKCPRSKLHQQCIKYLGPMERKPYEVYISTDGKLFHKQTGAPLHTAGEGGDVKWIFVLSTTKIMYVGRKKKGSFQHSSFLAGGAALAAGRLVVEDGILKSAWPHSGHYRPTAENFRDFLSFLQENKVDLTSVKVKQETRLDSWEVDTEDSTEVLQVGKQLSGTWTTGAGPRIRYVRDYPPELQVQVLEQVSLSPRSSSRLSCSSENNSGFSPGKPTPWNQKGNILMKEAAVICQSPR